MDDPWPDDNFSYLTIMQSVLVSPISLGQPHSVEGIAGRGAQLRGLGTLSLGLPGVSILKETRPSSPTWWWHKPQHTSAYQASACIMLVDVPLGKASHLRKPRVKVEGYEHCNHEPWKGWVIRRHQGTMYHIGFQYFLVE